MKKITKTLVPVANNYGNAFFEFSKENGNLEIDSADAVDLIEIFEKNDQLGLVLSFMDNLSESDKNSIMDTLKLDTTADTMKLLDILRINHRLYATKEILEVFLELVDKENKIIRGVAISAIPLVPEQLKEIEQAAINRLGAKQAILENIVDESVIGGVKIVTNNMVIDGTIQNSLNKVRTLLIND